MSSAHWHKSLRRLLFPLHKRLESQVCPLRYLFVEVTLRCNLDCIHCGSDCGREPAGQELSTDEWLAFFESIAEDFDVNSLVLVLTGGEPLCHPELGRLAEGMSRLGLSWAMVSNGWLLDDSRLLRLLPLGLRSVTVSLDGLAANHDHFRGRRGAFERACRAIGACAQHYRPRTPEPGLHFFDVVTCVHPGNLDDLPQLRALLRSLGVPAWRLFTIFPKGRAKADSSLFLSPEQLRRFFDFIEAQRTADDADAMHTQFSCEGYLPAALDAAVRDEPYFCRAGIDIGSVLSDGAISACPNISRSLVQGNIRVDRFSQVWEQRYQAFRDRSWMKTGECLDCAEWGQCQGNSMHLWDDDTQRTALCFHRRLQQQ
ncbi:MAG: radical SAM protein [Myxococcota bacterium]|nr:radical SAM protein [Myxococcota bacterium]